MSAPLGVVCTVQCPYCGSAESKVVETRESGDAETRRRRECEKCQKRFTTYEQVESLGLTVIKKDGSKEKFDRQKILRGIFLACSKRPVPVDQIERLVSSVEAQLKKRASTEIPSRLIGELVMRKLKSLDKVAYIRFASVYQDFDSITAFQQEVRNLLAAP